ncbi:uncharacterized protein Obp8a [Drosophila tropicalis]|uniref:uncharacterized protein Obp8a n=1 Tax=Drosophila tropicalis TaxID=46794 RepID=UPI0035AB6B89
MHLCLMLAVMLVLGLQVQSPAIGIDGAPTSSSRRLLTARDYCFRSGKLSDRQRLRLDHMAYENQEYAHRYVHCFWTKMQLWRDDYGFQAMRIVNHFGGPDRLNVEQAVPAINKCNLSTRSGAAANWCYRAFVCVMRTPVGEWFRRHMSDVINGNA